MAENKRKFSYAIQISKIPFVRDVAATRLDFIIRNNDCFQYKLKYGQIRHLFFPCFYDLDILIFKKEKL